MVTQNAANETGGGGGIVLGTGSTNYSVTNNFIAANFTAGNGGGIAHIGLSELGVIDAQHRGLQRVVHAGDRHQRRRHLHRRHAGGGGCVDAGQRQVDVTNNLIQGNAASGGDGGGVALLGFTNSDRVRLYNNMIANNVAGLAGGGISIDGRAAAAGNAAARSWTSCTTRSSTTTARARPGRRSAGPLTSTPQPAGIAGRGSDGARADRQLDRLAQPDLLLRTAARRDPGRDVRDRAGRPDRDPTQYAEIQITARPYWDLANLSGSQFSPIASVLSALTGPSSSANYLAGTNNVNYGANGNSADRLTAGS